MDTKFEELYQKYNLLSDAKDNISELADVYLECIEHTKGSDKEKKLAAQIIAKYFKNFPQHKEVALNAVFDLCEYEDTSIRINAIMVLPSLCKDSKDNASKVADILVQLMMLLEQQQEFNATCHSLDQVFRDYPEITLKILFTYIFKNKPSQRENAVKYIYKKLIKMDENITAKTSELLIEEGKKILQDSSSTEFLIIISYLKNTKLTKTTTGQQELVNAIAHRAEIHQEFDLDDKENLNCDRLIICTEHALPFFNANIESTEFVKFYCQQVLAKWEEIAELKEGGMLQYKLLQQLAELSIHCGKLEPASSYVVQIFDKIKRYMPLPPEDGHIDTMPNLDFTSVECLLFAFHRLARQCPDFLTADPAVLKDFRARLNYFSRGVGGCKRSLEKLQNKDDEKIKIAPAVLDNINTLIKDLFHLTPVYKCNVQLSFKTATSINKKELEKSTAVQKRHAPIQFDSNNGSGNKQIRSKGSENMKLYKPPSGKFSNNFQSYDRPGGRGRGRGGRGMRGGMRGSRDRGWKH